MKNKILFLGLILTGCFPAVYGQVQFTVDNSKSKVIIQGTSSIHDWEMSAKNMTAEFDLVREGNTVRDIRDVSFSIRAESLESDNSVMNKKTHNALKTDKYKTIRFKPAEITNIRSNGSVLNGTAKGKLFIAGQEENVEIPFRGIIKDGQSLIIEGEKKIQMSDFGIEPPTAMLGTLKTGDEVTVKFNLVFSEKNLGYSPGNSNK